MIETYDKYSGFTWGHIYPGDMIVSDDAARLVVAIELRGFNDVRVTFWSIGNRIQIACLLKDAEIQYYFPWGNYKLFRDVG